MDDQWVEPAEQAGQQDPIRQRQAYNSVWQLRADSWINLQEAATRLASLQSRNRPIDAMVSRCNDPISESGLPARRRPLPPGRPAAGLHR